MYQCENENVNLTDRASLVVPNPIGCVVSHPPCKTNGTGAGVCAGLRNERMHRHPEHDHPSSARLTPLPHRLADSVV